MTVTYATFIADPRHAPFANTFSETYITEVLTEVVDDLPVNVWGDGTLRDRATKLWTCHRLTVAQNAQSGVAVAGNVTSLNVSQGSQSASFSGGSNNPNDPEGLTDTVCGRELLALRRRVMGNFTGFVA